MATSFCVLLSAPFTRLDSPTSDPVQALRKVLDDDPLVDTFNSWAMHYFAVPPEKQQDICAMIAYLWIVTIPRREKEGWRPTSKDVLLYHSAIRLVHIAGYEKFFASERHHEFAEIEENWLKEMAERTGSSWNGAHPTSENLKTTLTGFKLAGFLHQLSQGTSDAFRDPDEIPDNEVAEGPTKSEFMVLLSPSERLLVCQGVKEAFNLLQKAKMNPGEKAALEAECLELGLTISPKTEELLEYAAKLVVHFEDLTRKQILEAREKVVVVNNRKVWPNPLP